MVDYLDARLAMYETRDTPVRCGELTTFTLKDVAECVLSEVVSKGEKSVPLPVGLSTIDCMWINNYVCDRIADMRCS